MDNMTYLHLCVSPTTGRGTVIRYERSLCSNCIPRDPRVFNLAVPSSEYESTKKRLEKEFNGE